LPTTTPGQTSFNGGEISPRMVGRTDLNQYLNSVSILENMTCLTQGPVTRRSGSRYVNEVFDSDVKHRLEPFVFSAEEAYTLEFGDKSMRVYKDEGFVLQPDATFIEEAVDATANTIQIAAHFYADNHGPVQLVAGGGGGVLPAPLASGTDYWIQYVDKDTIGLRASKGGAPIVLGDVGSTPDEPHRIEASANLPFTTHTPWTEDQLFSLSFAQSADVMYVAAGGTTRFHKIERRSDQDWRVVEVKLQDGPYLDENAAVGVKVTSSATLNNTTLTTSTDIINMGAVDLNDDFLTAAAHGFIDNTQIQFFDAGNTLATPLEYDTIYYVIFRDTNTFQLAREPDGPPINLTAQGLGNVTLHLPIFVPEDVGRIMRWWDENGDEWHWFTITAVTDYRTATAFIESTGMAVGTATARWRFGAFGDREDLGHPSQVSFNEQRLILAANPGAIQTVYASAVGDFEGFYPTEGGDNPVAPDDPRDTDAFQYTIAANQRNSIQWLRPVRSLLVGTLGGVWPMQASSQGEAISPTNVTIKQSSVHGTSDVQPLNVDDQVVYVSDTLHKIFSVGYTFERDAFLSTDLTLLAEHITSGGVSQIAYAHEPSSIIWAVRNDGQLLSLTFEQTQRIQGWARHIIGGSFAGGDAVVESVSVVPSPDQSHDQLWMIVKRTINGETKRYVEFLEENFPDSADVSDAFFVDSGLSSLTGPSVGPYSVPHLVGETVAICADGAPVASQVVPAGGTITLAQPATKVHIGLPYVSQMKSLPVTPPDPEGTSVGKLKRIPTVAIRFVRTSGGELAVGPDGASFDPIIFRKGGDALDTASEAFSGIVNTVLETGWAEDVFVWIRQSLPLPQTIAAIQARVSSSER
jgi:hypothetical protein